MGSSRVTGLGQWVTNVQALVLTVTAVMTVMVTTTTTTTTTTSVSHSIVDLVFSFGVVQGAVVKSFPQRTPHGFKNQNEKQKHPLEDVKSWKLHVERRNRNQQKLQEEEEERQQKKQQLSSIFSREEEEEEDDDDRRRLATYVKVVTDEKTPYTVLHKQIKPHLPFAGGDTTHGMMIDAGSQGTYLLFYIHS